MKNRKIIATVIAASMLVACAGCSKTEDKKDKDNDKKAKKEITSVVEDFFDAFIDCDASIVDLTNLSSRDASELLDLLNYADYEDIDAVAMIDSVFASFSYEVDEDSIEIDDDEAEVEVTFTHFDDEIFEEFEGVYDSIDDVCSAIRNGDTTETTITVELELNDDDEWIITNADDIVDVIDTLVDLSNVVYMVGMDDDVDDSDLGYTGYDWYNSDAGLDDVYTDAAYINFWGHRTGSGDVNTYFEVEHNGQLVFTSDVSTSIDCYFRASDYSASVGGYLPEGTYTITLYLEDGTVVDSGSCTVYSTNNTPANTGNGVDVDLEGDTYYGVCMISDTYEELYGSDLQGELAVDYTLVLADDGQFAIYVDIDQIISDFTEYMRNNLVTIISAQSGMSAEEFEDAIAQAGMSIDEYLDTVMASMTYTDSFESRQGTYTVDGNNITMVSEDNITYTATYNADGSITMVDSSNGVDVIIEFQPA